MTKKFVPSFQEGDIIEINDIIKGFEGKYYIKGVSDGIPDGKAFPVYYIVPIQYKNSSWAGDTYQAPFIEALVPKLVIARKFNKDLKDLTDD